MLGPLVDSISAISVSSWLVKNALISASIKSGIMHSSDSNCISISTLQCLRGYQLSGQILKHSSEQTVLFYYPFPDLKVTKTYTNSSHTFAMQNKNGPEIYKNSDQTDS